MHVFGIVTMVQTMNTYDLHNMYRTVIYGTNSVPYNLDARHLLPGRIGNPSAAAQWCVEIALAYLSPDRLGETNKHESLGKKVLRSYRVKMLTVRNLRRAFGILDTVHYTWILLEDPLSSQEQQYLSSHELLFANKRKSQAFFHSPGCHLKAWVVRQQA